MKLLYTTDLHGIKWKFEKMLKEAKSIKADLVINGGDMLPFGNFLNQDQFILHYLDDYLSKFNSEKIYYFSMLGNDDLTIFDDLFQQICDKYPFIMNIANKRIELEKYEFIGLNLVTDLPFALKDRARKDGKQFELPKQFGTPVISATNGWKKIEDWPSFIDELPTIEEELKDLIKPFKKENAIYVLHNPPSNLELDVCHDGRAVGSRAIYEFIKKNQPLISFHGHIHECPDVSGVWHSYLGKTLCIQPGQSRHHEDYLIYVLIDINESKNIYFERKKIARDK
ncbi:MAG: phosphoesterase [Promethearchaeota archaeon]|nr:MAG: phosphoesterase [Candidatus Lokiarchaeota archaeon]